MKSSDKSKSSKKSKGSEPKTKPEVKEENETPPPPPPEPPKPCCFGINAFTIDYPNVNKATLVYNEPFWSPTYPLCTSWGEIWVSQRPCRKIIRYTYNVEENKLLPNKEAIVTRGEPSIMTEIPKTRKVAVMLNCPTAKCTTIAVYNPTSLQVEHKIEYPYSAEDPDNIPSVIDPDTKKPQPRSFTLEDEVTPFGICANNNSICVLFDPLHKMQFFDCTDYKSQSYKLKNYCPDDKSSIQLAPSGGCVLTDGMLFVAAKNPNRVEAFTLQYRFVSDFLDRIDIKRYGSFGVDRFTHGPPFGIQIDNKGLLIASDGSSGKFHVFKIDRRPEGPCQPSLPNAESCYFGSRKVEPYQVVRPGYFTLSNCGIIAIVDRSVNGLHVLTEASKLILFRKAFCSDPGLKACEGKPDEPICECSLEDTWEQIPPEELLPDSWVKKFTPKDPNAPEVEEGKSDKSKKDKKSGKDSSNKKSSDKSKSSSGSKSPKKKKS